MNEGNREQLEQLLGHPILEAGSVKVQATEPLELVREAADHLRRLILGAEGSGHRVAVDAESMLRVMLIAGEALATERELADDSNELRSAWAKIERQARFGKCGRTGVFHELEARGTYPAGQEIVQFLHVECVECGRIWPILVDDEEPAKRPRLADFWDLSLQNEDE